MMMNHKKMAMMIVKGMSGESDKPDHDPTDDQSMKTPDEHKESDDARVGPELAMQKFIEAVEGKDVKQAVTAMMEFMEMSEGVEYYKDDVEGSMHESKED